MRFLNYLIITIAFFSFHSAIAKTDFENKFDILPYQKNYSQLNNVIHILPLFTLYSAIIYISDQIEREAIKNLKFTLIPAFITILFSTLFFTLYTKQQKHLKKLELLIQQIHPHKKSTDKERNSIEESVIYQVLIGLKNFENEFGFLETNVSLISLSKELNTNPSYLSKIINTYKKQKFSSYVNELRINYVLSRLKTDRKLSLYTIKAISDEAGFNNSQSFTNAFYKKTGLYPSHYIKQLKTISNKKIEHMKGNAI